MVTEKTPDHKRVARAEKAREEWRTKAIDRREQSEILKEKIERKNDKIYRLNTERCNLQQKLKLTLREVDFLRAENDQLKKKNL